MNFKLFKLCIFTLFFTPLSISGQTNTFPTSGNVGVGTTTPGVKLDVIGDVRATNFLGTVTPYPLDIFTHDGKTMPQYGVKWVADSWNTSGATLWASGYSGLKLFTTAQPRLVINNLGNVGIGTTTPQAKLDVSGNIKASGDIMIADPTTPGTGGKSFQSGQFTTLGETINGSGTIIGNNIKGSPTNSNNVRRFASNNNVGNFLRLQYNTGITFHTNISSPLNTDMSSDINEVARFALNGNMGIGTTTPQAKLDVFGKIIAGSTSSPNGDVILEGRYGQGNPNTTTNGSLFSMGTMYSSGDPYWGYGIKTQSGANGYLSSTNIPMDRAGIELGGNSIKFLIGNTQTSTDGGAVSLTQPVTFTKMGIGVGTTTPSAKVDIVQDGTNAYGVRVTATSAALNPQMRIEGNASIVKMQTVSGSNLTQLGAESNSDLGLLTNNTAKIYIKAVGDVGIGTTTPSAKLDVNGSIKSSGDILLADASNAGGRGRVFQTGAYTTLGETIGGAGAVIGNNIKVSPSNNNNIRRFANGTDAGNFMRLQYNTGITFHTNVLSALNTDVPSESNEVARFALNGNMGIGTTTPNVKLEVAGNVKGNGYSTISNGLFSASYDGSSNNYIGTYSWNHLQLGNNGMNYIVAGRTKIGGSLRFVVNNINDVQHPTQPTGLDAMDILYNGNVGIGTPSPQAKLDVKGDIWSDGIINISTTTPPPGYKLAVAGNAIAEKVVVKFKVNWPDYVFKPDYKLPPLSIVEQSIKKEGHLPNMPSEKEVAEQGIDLGSMDAKLLQKIEELTLYLIKQEKRLEAQQKEIDDLKKLIRQK